MFRDIPPLEPVHFVDVSFLLPYSQKEVPAHKKYLLQDMTPFFLEESFTDVYAGFNEEGISFLFKKNDPLFTPPDPKEESIEIFIDTKAQAHRKYAGPFSHHFLITYTPFEGYYAREISRFSGESHPLCSPQDVTVSIEKKRKETLLALWIPSFALHGFDPDTKEIRFTYKINRPQGEPQHFTCRSSEVNIWQNSYLWAHFLLKK
jgi:hypothetical protein